MTQDLFEGHVISVWLFNLRRKIGVYGTLIQWKPLNGLKHIFVEKAIYDSDHYRKTNL